MCLIVQSLEQIQRFYGKSYKTIILNCVTKLIFSGCEISDCKYISEMVGTIHIPKSSRNFNETNNINQADGDIRKKQDSQSESSGEISSSNTVPLSLIMPAELRQLKRDKAILIQSNKKAAIIPLKPFFETVSRANTLESSKTADLI